MLVRPARFEDAEEIASVLRRSIRELCFLDHSGEAQALEEWLGNKTADNVRLWIAAPDRHIVVAEDNDTILGVGGASRVGEITLNYVAPEARFQGVSKSIIGALEAYLHALGLRQSTLTSTRTAHRFYLALGYADTKKPGSTGVSPDLQMHKLL